MNKLYFVPDLLTGRLNDFDAKRYFSRIGWFAFAYHMIGSGIVTLAFLIANKFAPALLSNFLFMELLSFIPSYAVALPIAYQIIKPLPTVTPDKEKMKVSHWFGGLCISLVLMTVGNYITNIVLSMISRAFSGVVTENPVENVVERSPIWATVLFVVILAPILEEIVFRRILCKKLLILGDACAIIIPSAFFALCHGNLYQLFYAFTLGCFFSFIYIKTGKLRYTIFFHMAINLIGGVISPLVMDLVNYDAIMSGNFKITARNILPLLGFMWYELMTIGAMVIGVIIIIKNLKKFAPQSGLLLLPERRAFGCIILNPGVITALSVFAFVLVSSVFT